MIDSENTEFSFAEFITDLGHGATNKLASQRLRELVDACRTTGRKGTLTISIAVSMSGEGIAELRASIKTTRPEAPLPGGAYYVTDTGGLVTEDPRQASLPLPKVMAPSPVIQINPKNGGKAS